MPAPAEIQRLGPCLWELGSDYRAGMRVPVRVFASEKLLAEMDDKVARPPASYIFAILATVYVGAALRVSNA